MTAIPNNISRSDADAAVTQEALQKWLANYRGYLDVFLDAYCVVDVTNKVVEFNTAFAELCGESYRRILKIGDFCELVKTQLCPNQCPAKQIITSEKSIRLDELSASSKGHENLTIILGGVPIFWPGLGTIGSLITIRDVSAETELQKKYDERKRDSITDGLTRLYNKVYTEAHLLRMVKTALRENVPVSLVMCDIDHFKKVNDVYGHQAGDHVLVLVAQLLKGETRDSDVAGRFGGEEFMAVLYNSPKNGAKIFTERFRSRVEKLQVFFENKIIPVTVSLGTATIHRKWEQGIDPEQLTRDLINQADTALYLAKANGRNQVCQFEDIPQKKRG